MFKKILSQSARPLPHAAIFGPVDQARRCLDLWLKKENRVLVRPDRRKLSALLARYFEHENPFNDQLMLSFLDHYAGNRAIDMEDAATVRFEIKTILDRSYVMPSRFRYDVSWPLTLAVATGLLAVIATVAYTGWHIATLPMTDIQAMALKNKVAEISARTGQQGNAAVWSKIKKPLNIRRYQDITYWQYGDAMEILDNLPQ